jgi:hypothetical protein
MRVQFALCAQTASIDRNSNRLSIFNVIDQYAVSSLPIVIPALTFVSVIESSESQGPNVKGVLEVLVNGSATAKVEIPLTFVTGRLARVVVNFQGLHVREAGPVTFRLAIPGGATAETTFHVIHLASSEAIQVTTPSVIPRV